MFSLELEQGNRSWVIWVLWGFYPDSDDLFRFIEFLIKVVIAEVEVDLKLLWK